MKIDCTNLEFDAGLKAGTKVTSKIEHRESANSQKRKLGQKPVTTFEPILPSASLPWPLLDFSGIFSTVPQKLQNTKGCPTWGTASITPVFS